MPYKMVYMYGMSCFLLFRKNSLLIQQFIIQMVVTNTFIKIYQISSTL